MLLVLALIACKDSGPDDSTADDSAPVDDSSSSAQDADGDGFPSWELTTDPTLADCDDLDPQVTPATERYVPGGPFWQGGGYNPDTQPERSITLSPYCVDRLELTNAQFLPLLEALAAAGTPNTDPQGRQVFDFLDVDDEVPERILDHGDGTYSVAEGFADHPVVEVYEWSAELYCGFVGKSLPTEAEWEKAARGEQDHRFWPWGDTWPTCALANIRPGPEGVDQSGEGVEPCVGDTVAVGSYPEGASPYGALDMIGNVAEWVSDWYQPDYYAEAPDTDPPGPAEGWDGLETSEPAVARVTRGGNHATADVADDVVFRYVEPDWASSNGIGFRCVRRLTPTDPSR